MHDLALLVSFSSLVLYALLAFAGLIVLVLLFAWGFGRITSHADKRMRQIEARSNTRQSPRSGHAPDEIKEHVNH